MELNYVRNSNERDMDELDSALTGFIVFVLGCVGGINGLANILGNEVCNVYKLFKKAKLQEAVELHLRLVTPNALVRNLFNVLKLSDAI